MKRKIISRSILLLAVFAAYFLLTSLAAALLDTVLVIVQRYNRPQVIRLIELQKKGCSNHGKSIQLPEK